MHAGVTWAPLPLEQKKTFSLTLVTAQPVRLTKLSSKQNISSTSLTNKKKVVVRQYAFISYIYNYAICQKNIISILEYLLSASLF
jgi:hypothetical protein